ncbi:MAG: glycosyltransferase family 2 protein [Phycisphaerae bacterium]|nr:glycosyltransferase family 2 protein [Phycisphaerae bacterium]
MEIDTLARVAIYAYLVVLTVICIYGAHRYFLVTLYYRVRFKTLKPRATFDELPRVTVQLPMYNEQYVARRIIERTCEIDYPRDRLQIQVLDDSTDDTQEIARETVERMLAAGHDIMYLHRDNRVGYKAGALEEGTRQATGEFITIFDSDFLPPPGILQNTIHHFTDPKVGMVQSRWEHLNRDISLLTKAQAILLDGHFVIEHTARNRSGRFMSFNGTAGIWRKATITDAGGWQHDTLTEDLDLSYRAQLRGWKFVFLPQMTSPAELPPEMNAFKAQQHRWTKGGAQTCVKLLPRVLGSDVKWWIKLESFFHLTSGAVYVMVVLLSLLIGPTLIAKLLLKTPQSPWVMWFEFMLFVIGFGSTSIFYIVSQQQLQRGWWYGIRFVPALMAVGIGIAFNNAFAALDGFFGKTGEFVRTPKFGDTVQTERDWRKRLGGLKIKSNWKAWAELGMGLYLVACCVALFFFENWFQRVSMALPFMLIFITGYFYVAFMTFYTGWLSRRGPRTSVTA